MSDHLLGPIRYGFIVALCIISFTGSTLPTLFNTNDDSNIAQRIATKPAQHIQESQETFDTGAHWSTPVYAKRTVAPPAHKYTLIDKRKAESAERYAQQKKQGVK